MIFSKEASLAIYILSILLTFFVSNMCLVVKKTNQIKIKCFDKKYYIKWENLFFVLTPVFLIIITTIRENVGTDYSGYKMYYDCIEGNIAIPIEPLYKIINEISILVFHNFYGVLLISAIITNYFILCGMRNYLGKYFPIGMFLYCCVYFFLTFNGIRQMLSVSIVFFAYKYILEKDWKKYFLFCVLASLLHQTAIIAVVFYFVTFIEYKKLTVKKFLFYALLLLSPLYIQTAVSLVTRIILPKYSSYIGATKVGIGFLVQYSLPLFLICCTECNVIKLKSYQEYEKFKNLFLLTIPLRVLGYMNMYIARLSWYTEIIQIVLVILIVKLAKNVRIKYCVITIAIFYYGYYFWQTFYVSNSSEVFPYIINSYFL